MNTSYPQTPIARPHTTKLKPSSTKKNETIKIKNSQLVKHQQASNYPTASPLFGLTPITTTTTTAAAEPL